MTSYPPSAYRIPAEQTLPYNVPPAYAGLGLAEKFQRRQDEDNLHLLSIFHYIMGGLTILGASVFLFHFGMGLAMLLDPSWMNLNKNGTPPAFMGWMFTLMGGAAVLLGWALGILTIYAGRCLTRQKSYNLAFVLACLNCLNAPMGTALGVFTILVLSRPSVKALFDVPGAAGPVHPSSSVLSDRPWYRGQ